jgi:hypothetical protein
VNFSTKRPLGYTTPTSFSSAHKLALDSKSFHRFLGETFNQGPTSSLSALATTSTLQTTKQLPHTPQQSALTTEIGGTKLPNLVLGATDTKIVPPHL